MAFWPAFHCSFPSDSSPSFLRRAAPSWAALSLLEGFLTGVSAAELAEAAEAANAVEAAEALAGFLLHSSEV